MKNILLFTALILRTSATNAQKLPNIQTLSLKAPANVKIDGKPSEWNEMQAYNKATDVAYTISNDADNIYLVVQSKEPAIIVRLVKGRVTLTVNKTGKKSEDGAVAVSYPVFEKGNRPGLTLHEKLSSPKIADSIVLINNNQLEKTAKLIKVTGVSGLDSLISAYNDNGIKAAARFDNKMTYTCELAISLKLLGLAAADASKFSYNVRVNGISYDDLPGVNITRDAGGQITAINIIKSESIKSPVNMTAPTDFWGEYALVK